MDNKTYQEEASKTIPNSDVYTKTLTFNNDKVIVNALLGLSGESGELVDVFKKHYFQGHDLDKDDVIKECVYKPNDVMEYITVEIEIEKEENKK